MTTLLIAVVWYIIGVLGYVFWWTRDFKLTSNQIETILYSGVLGPFAWIAGYFIHRT